MPHGSSEPAPRLLALWAGILAGPLVWAALLQTNYILSYVACEQRQKWMLHLATAIALALVAAAAAAAWRAAPPRQDDEHASEHPGGTSLLRRRFMALGGLALCAWFAVVILATEIPALVQHPCTW
ncbi:MAG TPA: hypothetical protein VFK57_03830 [Vicinamibacterales bacterium]|nr:hypothetical protein [Vicinamibacterales bacterium]